MLNNTEHHLAKKVISRDLVTSSKKRGVRGSLLLDLVVLQRMKFGSKTDRFLFYILAAVFKIKLSWMILKNDISIIPADIWDLVPINMRSRVILEIRWLTQDLINTLEIPLLAHHSYENASFSGIPEMPREVFSEFLGYFTYSSISKESIILSGAKPDKILVLPLLRHDALAISNEFVESRSQRLLYVGRSAPDKRLDLAVEIADKLNLPLDVVGKYDTAARKWLENKTGVNYLGVLPHSDLLAIMKSNIALLAPGVESWNLAVVEALQCGMVVYASRFTGVTEWINHPNLHVIPEMDSDLFVKEFDAGNTRLESYNIFSDIDFEYKWRIYLTNLGLKHF